jgi:FkbM family methyltransferase
MENAERDFWVAYSGFNEPTFMKDVGDGQGDLRRVAYKYIKQWRTCVDIGANVGMWTRFLMKDFQKVICFEPNQLFAECFKRNIPNGLNAELHQVGLSNTKHTANYENKTDQVLQNEPGDILCLTLDSYDFKDIDFIKIDVDGFEDKVIEGAMKTIESNKPVINIEMKRLKRPRVCRRVDSMLKSLSYQVQTRNKSDEVWIKV